MRYLTFALTKGRLADKTLSMLEKTGITCEEMKDKDSRKLIFVNEELKLRFFLAKGPDVPTYVEYGAADIGVVGKDTLVEEGRKMYEVLDLGFGKCRFCLCGKKGEDFYAGYHTRTIASKYPKVTRDFFSRKNMDVNIIKIEGSVELAPLLGLADAIVDIVETGTTLKENGLEPYETVAPISARVIVNLASMKLKKQQIQALTEQLQEGLRAKDETKKEAKKAEPKQDK